LLIIFQSYFRLGYASPSQVSKKGVHVEVRRYSCGTPYACLSFMLSVLVTNKRT